MGFSVVIPTSASLNASVEGDAVLAAIVGGNATLTAEVAIPGPKGDPGPQGPQGIPGPPGETFTGGQITSSIYSYNSAEFRTYDGLYNQVTIGPSLIQLTYGGSGGNALSIEWNGITFADGKQTVRYPGTSILDGYATQSWVTTQLGSYATIASLGTAAYQPTSYWIQSPAVAATDGQIPAWDSNTNRPIWIDNSARTVFLTGVNKSGATIPKGAAVYISGGQGGTPIISLAVASAEGTSSNTIGITTQAIAQNAQGNVCVAGLATKLDTSAYSEGQILYLSPTTPGGFVTSLPTQPYHGVVIGFVTRSNNSNGSIEVHIQNYQELEELSDVLVSNRTNNDILAWDTATLTWRNKSASSMGILDNVVLTSPADGDVLIYNDSKFRNEPKTTLVDGGNF